MSNRNRTIIAEIMTKIIMKIMADARDRRHV